MDEKARLTAQIDYYIRLVLRKRWYIIIPFCISMLVGIYLAITLPKIYSASNLILVVAKSVPDRYVPSVLETDIQDRINTIRQQIMSRSNLERLISDLNLFPGPEHERIYLVDKIEKIRKNTEIHITKSRGGIDSFTIEYKGTEPQTVMQVVNRLSDSFINESVKIMENEIIDTNQFLDDELGTLKTKLTKIEDAIIQYRRAHTGELPEELNSNLSTIERLQSQLSEKQENLRDAKNRLSSLEERIAFVRSNSANLLSENPPRSKSNEPEMSDLDQLRALLERLQIKYTAKHPDIIRIKDTIAKLEAQEKASPGRSAYSSADDALSYRTRKNNAVASANLSRMQFDLDAQYKDLRREIGIYENDIYQIERKIEEYQQKVERTPDVKHELLSLERVHANVQDQYNRFLERKLESDIAVNVEKKQKGQKFRVLDSARLPQKPVSPDIKKLLAMCVIAGLGVGAGLIFLYDYFDHSLRIPANVEPTYGVPVLAIIPRKMERKDRIKHRFNQFATAFSLSVGCFLLSIMALFATKGVDRTVEWFDKFI